MRRPAIRAAVCALFLIGASPLPACAETPDEWIALVTRVHGGFGSFIPLGIRIGSGRAVPGRAGEVSA